MTPILVAGTNSWQNDHRVDWYCPSHPFGQFLDAAGVPPAFDGAQPFIWSTALAGIPFFTKKRDWAAGGAALAYYIISRRTICAANTALIVHSHALQVAAYAAMNHNLKAKTLISVGSPLREDMKIPYMSLRANVQYWLHIHSDGSDRWQWFGEMFDGHFGIVRATPYADWNDFVPDVGHSELLRDPAQYHQWVDHHWLDRLR